MVAVSGFQYLDSSYLPRKKGIELHTGVPRTGHTLAIFVRDGAAPSASIARCSCGHNPRIHMFQQLYGAYVRLNV